ncbi:MAG TPA: hypothetical protein VG651_18605 [Stellaceae bacterium]|nr:hypothetical protein [Stellaceae bacterium]
MPAWLNTTAAKVVLWFLTTIGAAVLGTFAGSYIDRPSPGAAITGIEISQKYNEQFGKNQIVEVPLNSNLYRHLNQSMWTPPFHEQSADLSDLMKTLTQNHDQINRLVRDLNNFEKILPELRNLLYASANTVVAETFFDKWEPLDGLIDAAIMGDTIRGTFTRPAIKNHDGQTSYLLIRETPGRASATDEAVTLYLVSKRGGTSSSYAVPRYKQNEEDAHALSVALAYFDQDNLNKYVDAVAAELQSRSLYEEMLKELATYLRGYSRWSVSVLVSNAGSHAISFSPYASLYINTAGTSMGNGYTVINLVSMNENGQLDATVLDGGESKMVRFVSEKIVSSDDNWQPLLALYDTSSRGSFVVLHPESNFWNRSSNLSSALAAFGPANAGQRLSDKEIADHFKQ